MSMNRYRLPLIFIKEATASNNNTSSSPISKTAGLFNRSELARSDELEIYRDALPHNISDGITDEQLASRILSIENEHPDYKSHHKFKAVINSFLIDAGSVTRIKGR